MALIQNELLKNGEKSILSCKTYIYEGTIYHKYLSDIIRVRQPKKRMPGFQYIDKKILDKYRNMSNEELHKLFDQTLINNMFDTRYFVFDKYRGPNLKHIARLTSDASYYKYMLMLNYFVKFPLLMFSALVIGFVFNRFDIFNVSLEYLNYRFENLISLMLMVGLATLLTLYKIIKKMINPTQFEILLNEKEK